MSDEPKQWWQTLPAIIVGLATLLTALTGLLVALNQLGVFKHAENKSASPPEVVSATPYAQTGVTPANTATAPFQVAAETPTAAFAQPSPPSSSKSEFIGGYDPAMAFVDVQRIFKEYAKTKTAETKINDSKSAAKKEYDNRAYEYKRALDEINNLNSQLNSHSLSNASKDAIAKERDDKIANIKSMEREIDDFRQTREHQLQEQARRMREGIVSEITEKIRALGGNVANIIFDKSGMSLNGVPVFMYSPNRGDVSSNVIQALNNGSHSTVFAPHKLHIAAVDMNRAFKSYSKTKDAEAKINEERNVARQEYDDRTNGYKHAIDDVNQLNKQIDAGGLSSYEKTRLAKSRDDKMANIKKMEKEITEFGQTREHQLQEQTMRLREGIVREITDAIMAVIKTNDTEVVLDISGMSPNNVPIVIYWQGIPDLTDQAVAKLNGTNSSSNMPASSDSSGSLRFGIVDMYRAFKAWPETKEAEAKINDEKAAAKNEYAGQSPVEREKRDKQIEEDAKRLREPIVAKIRATASICAEREGFNLVFGSSVNSLNGVPVVVFTRDLPDLTDAVLKEHDRPH